MIRKQLAAVALCFALIFTICTANVFAADDNAAANESVSITYLEDGYYLVTVLQIYDTRLSPIVGVKFVSGAKTTDLYYGDGSKVCSLTVEGTFSFDGNTAKATRASYSYTIYNVLWSFSDGSAYWEDNTAYATATFKYLGIQFTTLSVSLSCSPNGVLS